VSLKNNTDLNDLTHSLLKSNTSRDFILQIAQKETEGSTIETLIFLPYGTYFGRRVINKALADWFHTSGWEDTVTLIMCKVRATVNDSSIKLECGPMPNVMAALPNIGGALCSMLQSLTRRTDVSR